MSKTHLLLANAIAVSMVLTTGFTAQSTQNSTAEIQTQETRIRDVQTNRKAQDLYPLEQPLLAQETQVDSVQPTTTELPATTGSREGFYVSVSGDARFISKATIDPIDVGISVNPGFGINTALGYRFRNNLRVEGEFSYGSNHVNEVNLPGLPATTIPTLTTNTPFVLTAPLAIPGVGTIPAGTTIPSGIVLNPGPPITTASTITIGGVTIPAGTNLSGVPGLALAGGTPTTTVVTPAIAPATINVDGRISTLSGLLNLYYDIPTGSRFEPYIGGGVGASRASADDLSLTYPGIASNLDISGSSTVFVYQLRAGVAYNLNPNSAITLGYRYFNVARQSFNVAPLGELKINGLGVHNIELGLRYFF